MSSRVYILAFLLALLPNKRLASVDDQPCCESWEKNGWEELGLDFYNLPLAVCHNSETRSRPTKGQRLLVNYQPINQFGIIGISACNGVRSNDCYVAEIFGLVSGRLGYRWRKHADDIEGDKRWIPGRKTEVPATTLEEETSVEEGTWDRAGKTIYQLYIEKTSDDRLEILLNGGDSAQQEKTSFTLPEKYSWLTIASKDNVSKAIVEGATGCSKYKRIIFEPGQDVRVQWVSTVGSLGLSLCTDTGQTDCYVLDLFGYKDGRLSYWWRRHDVYLENGRPGWVPGRESGVSGIQLRGFRETTEFSRRNVTFIFRRDLDGTLSVQAVGGDPDQLPDLKFEVPANYTVGSVGTFYHFYGIDLYYSHIRLLGPCFAGETLGYLSVTCKYEVPLRGLRLSTGAIASIWAPKPGKTQSEVTSPVLKLSPNRQQLCVSLVGIANAGGSISVSAFAASHQISDSVYLGNLSYNGVNPPEWQYVRLSVPLPPALQNISLVVKLTAQRSAEGLVLLRKAELCAYDGCGLPTAEGNPFIAFGDRAPFAKYPWHVGIHKTDGVLFEYICGGSLIRADVVISAAHCFFDTLDHVLDKSQFKLAAGKAYNSLYEYEAHQQLSNALELHIPERYKGLDGNYVHDIAIVIVNFTTSSVILPVCIDWSNRALPKLHDGDIGEVAGWGWIENLDLPNRELLFARLPFIPYDPCAATVPKEFVRFVTTDKFCAGNVNGQAVRKGDSGGGLAFNVSGLYYLRGIVSTGVSDRLTYSTFTDISQFLPWIKERLHINDSLLL